MNENSRFLELLDTLISNGIADTYVQISNTLETNKQAISDLKGGRKKLSIDILRRMKNHYPQINLEWILMGKGDMFLDNGSIKAEGIEEKLLQRIEKKDAIIREQAEELGVLRERLLQFERMAAKNANDAHTETIASAG